MNPSGKLEIDEDPDLFKSNADIIEAVCKGVNKEEDVDSKIEECSPPQMSQPEMAGLSESLRSICIDIDIKMGYELSKMLRKFEAQLWAVELHKSTQQRLDVQLGVGALLLSMQPVDDWWSTDWIFPNSGKTFILHIFDNA